MKKVLKHNFFAFISKISKLFQSILCRAKTLTKLNICEMAAMPFPCNGLLLYCAIIPKELLMFFSKFASCSIPYFKFAWDCLALALNSLGWFTYIVSQVVFLYISYKKLPFPAM